MPTETVNAVNYALNSEIVLGDNVIKVFKIPKNEHIIVDFVREYFNDNDINYDEFSFEDLTPFLN